MFTRLKINWKKVSKYKMIKISSSFLFLGQCDSLNTAFVDTQDNFDGSTSITPLYR